MIAILGLLIAFVIITIGEGGNRRDELELWDKRSAAVNKLITWSQTIRAPITEHEFHTKCDEIPYLNYCDQGDRAKDYVLKNFREMELFRKPTEVERQTYLRRFDV